VLATLSEGLRENSNSSLDNAWRTPVKPTESAKICHLDVGGKGFVLFWSKLDDFDLALLTVEGEFIFKKTMDITTWKSIHCFQSEIKNTDVYVKRWNWNCWWNFENKPYGKRFLFLQTGLTTLHWVTLEKIRQYSCFDVKNNTRKTYGSCSVYKNKM
jgi:hypothetical protein